MISSKKMRFAVTTAAAAAVVTTGAFAANVTSTTNVNVRSGPGNSYSVLTVMKSGTTTSSLGTSGNWTKVTVNGKTGYVYSKYLSGTGNTTSVQPSTPTTSTSKTVYITASALNVRSGAGTSYNVIGTLTKGKSASVVGTSGNWYKIKYGSGYGYISSSYTSTNAPSNSTSNTPPTTSTSNAKTYYCTTAGLNVRSGPGTSYASKGSLSLGQAVSVVDSSSYWHKIKFGSGYGYVGSKYLSASKPSGSTSTPSNPSSVAPTTKTVYTTCSLNVRSGAGTSYSVIGVLASGKSASVVGTSGSWYKIKYGSGYGYIGSAYTTSTAPSSNSTPSTPNTPSSNSSIVSYAKTFLGRPYVYGAAGPRSFDCSGFTQYVYAHFGKSIPRSSAAQYASCSKISKSSLRAGDLVFFSNSSSGGSVGHVAIYMGNGQIIHAANSRRGVCTDSLNSSYYTSHYIGAGRY